MKRLRELRLKLAKRIGARDRQARLWRQTGKAGHGKAARRHQEAVRFLRDLIHQVTVPKGISDLGVRFIAYREGFSPVPYDQLDGHATVGYGELLHYGRITPADLVGIWVKNQKTPGRLTKPEARRLLHRKLGLLYVPAVMALFVKGGPLYGLYTPWRFDALVSFVYNLGPAAIKGGPGFETIGSAIQRRDLRAIADALLLYDKANGSALAGLTYRREAERRMFLTGEYGPLDD